MATKNVHDVCLYRGEFNDIISDLREDFKDDTDEIKEHIKSVNDQVGNLRERLATNETQLQGIKGTNDLILSTIEALRRDMSRNSERISHSSGRHAAVKGLMLPTAAVFVSITGLVIAVGALGTRIASLFISLVGD